MPEYLAPGVFVEEQPGGVKPIAGVSTSTIGMVGLTERGPVDRPTLVTSFGEFTRVFGGLLDRRVYTEGRHALPYAVQGAFDNRAGRIYVSRIAGANATFAQADLLGDAPDGAPTTLVERAVAGATTLRIADGAGLAQGARLLISDGPRSEYVTAEADPVFPGVTLTGRLHAAQPAGTAVVLQEEPVVGDDLSANVTGDMGAGGGLLLDAATVATLAAGEVLRIRQSAGEDRTEYVTIDTDGAAGIREGGLLFDHPQAEVEVHRVTLTDSATTTTLSGAAEAGAAFLALASLAGLDPGAVLAVGAGATREVHVLRTVASDVSIASTPTASIHNAGITLRRQVPLLRVHARDEGQWANRLRVRARATPLCETTVTGAVAAGGSPVPLTTCVGLYPGSVVAILRAGTEIARQRVTRVSESANEIELAGGAGAALQADDRVVSQEFGLTVELLGPDGKVRMDEAFDGLAIDPAHPRYAPNVLGSFDRSRDESSAAGLSDLVRLSDLTLGDDGQAVAGADRLRLVRPFEGVASMLAGGEDDLATVDAQAYVGVDAVDVEDRTGLQALTAVDDVSIVAIPGQSSQQVQNAMLIHCELMRYRIAVLDGQAEARMADIQAQRQLHDSTRGALYHPWFLIADPFGRPGEPLAVPPSGHVCGAYALTDVERGVHKAPANVVVRGILGLQATITTGQQEILNPRGINVIRDFSGLGRGKRIWGARTVSSDPEWIYVPVRRLFLFVEKSIERGMQFAVFEPNGPALWATVRRSLENFLLSVWRSGALLGNSPEEAFFIDVGPNTMTQADLDAGRLIVLIGIAPVKPAEFVIIRISQKTAGAPQ